MFEQFFIENLLLFAALLVVIALFFALPGLATIGGSEAVSALHLPQLQRSKHVIIDVSTSAEYDKGHLPGALSAPLDELLKDSSTLDKHKAKNLIITCANGSKSIRAGKHLKKMGFQNLHHLSGGLVAWQRESLPVES